MEIEGTLICNVCHKPVDRVDIMESVVRDGFRYTAYCHGEKEQSFLPRFDLIRAERIVFGRAFSNHPILFVPIVPQLNAGSKPNPPS